MTPERDKLNEQFRNLLSNELRIAYQSQLSKFPSRDVEIDAKIDLDTISLLHSGELPMPINHKLPEKVWRVKGWFQAEPGLNIELIIGEFYGAPFYAPLGMHDGKGWVYRQKYLAFMNTP